MYGNTFIAAAVAALATGVSANPYGNPTSLTLISTPASSTSASACTSATPPPGETYVSGFPLCGIPGFTEVPGCYEEIIHQSSGATLEGCRDDCIHNSTCKSYAFSPQYTDCIFYDHVAEDLQLYSDDESNFVHYDICCSV